jgi:NAD(P)-dependent dehydrogenase (short-subunit alcohol dehydrogenase family)
MRLGKGALALAGMGFWAYRRLTATRWDPAGKVVLITGGGRGLGLELARAFAKRGARLVLCSRSIEELARAQGELGRKGCEVHTRLCDVTDEGAVRRLVDEAHTRFGRIDMVVNNASILQVGPLEAMTRDDFRDAVEVNFWGTVNVTLAALCYLRQTGGRVVNITSLGGVMPVPHLLPYGAAKHAAVGFSEGLATEVGRQGVRVLTVVPGLMRTGSHHHAQVKGNRAKEARWFALGASAPLLSISSARAAEAIVAACVEGRRYLVLGVPARVARLFHALAPEASLALMSFVNRLLPAPVPDTAPPSEAHEHLAERGRSPLTRAGEQAAERNNELVEEPPPWLM